MLALFYFSDALRLSSLALLVVGLGALSGIPMRYLVGGLRPAFWLAVITILAQGYLIEGQALFTGLPFTWEGVHKGALFGLRFVVLVLLSSVFTLTTDPLQTTDAAARLLKPLRVIGLPSQELALMATLAFRFVPVLALEGERLVKAQLSRGAPLDRGSPWVRLRALGSILLPLFLRAFGHAENLALSMEARCYTGTAGRTASKPMYFSMLDLVFALFLLGFMTALAWQP